MSRRLLLVVTALAVVSLPLVTPPRAEAGGLLFVIRGEITENVALKRQHQYLLQGTAFLRPGATMRVQAGTTILCDTGSRLVVSQHARLVARGTAERPIVFTSAQLESDRRRGDWGGIVVNGYAPVAASNGFEYGDGGTGRYGGYDEADDSGAIRYVRIEYAGYALDASGPSAALSLRGVGSGTEIDSVEALNSGGDGVEVRGGSVDLRRVASIGNERRALAWTKGWNGRAQFLLVQQRGDVASPLYTALFSETNTPVISNVTIVGGASGLAIGGGGRGDYRNIVVLGCKGTGLDFADQETVTELVRGNLTLAGLVMHDNAGGTNVDAETREALARNGSTVFEADPMLANARDEARPDFRPVAGSPSLSSEVVEPVPADEFFVAASYAGAFGPGEDEDWTAGWVNYEIPPDPVYLSNSHASPEALATAFLDALAREDVTGIIRLRLSEKEFCWYVWPELESSQIPGLDCGFVWRQATIGSNAGLREMYRRHAGQRYELVSVRFAGGSDAYPSYVVHNDTLVTIRDASGAEREVKLFGSMLELNGRYKLFSFVLD